MEPSSPLIPRPHYLDRIISAKDTPFVKVITGIRRSGKSSLLKMTIDSIKSSGVPDSKILYIDFNIDSPDLPTDHRTLTDYVESRVPVHPGTYIFLDEVQDVKEWEISVTSFYTSGADVYITGSNSQMLSSEIATKLSGRCVEIHVMPLVFSEYVEFRRENISKDTLFSDFIRDGSLPAIALYEDTTTKPLIPEILTGTYNTVFLKDVIERNGIRNPAALSNLSKFMMRNIGDRTSARSASRYLTSNGQKISHISIEEYMKHLEEAFLFSRSERIDSKSKEYLLTTDKFYCSDLGIRNNQVLMRVEDLDGILENVVYNELLFRHRKVAVCSVGTYEIDFVTDPETSPEYYQVCMNIGETSTRERELRSLKMIHDNHPKYIITYDRFPMDSIDGIKIVQIVDWLLEKE